MTWSINFQQITWQRFCAWIIFFLLLWDQANGMAKQIGTKWEPELAYKYIRTYMFRYTFKKYLSHEFFLYLRLKRFIWTMCCVHFPHELAFALYWIKFHGWNGILSLKKRFLTIQKCFFQNLCKIILNINFDRILLWIIK